MKPILTTLLFASILTSAAETIAHRTAQVVLPDPFNIKESTPTDCGGLTITAKHEDTHPTLTLRIGHLNSKRNLHPSPEEIADLEYFERNPESWFGYHCVVLRHEKMRIVEMRHPIENVFIRAILDLDECFQSTITAMKTIEVTLAEGWHLSTSEEDRSFRVQPIE